MVDPERLKPYLQGITWPVTASELARHVRSQRPPDEVLHAVAAMPPGEWHSEGSLLEAFRQAQEQSEVSGDGP